MYLLTIGLFPQIWPLLYCKKLIPLYNAFMTGTCRNERKNMPPCKPEMQVAEVAAYHDKGVQGPMA